MSSIFAFLLLAATASSLAVQGDGSQIIQLPSPGLSLPQLVSPLSNGNNVAMPSNHSIPVIHAVGNDYDFMCNENQYGYLSDSDVQDCLEAMQTIKSGRNRVKFAERNNPERIGDVFPLPWRWMGSTSLNSDPRACQS